MQGAVDHHVERRLGLGDPAHAVGQAGRSQPVLAEAVAVAPPAEDLRIVHAQILDDDLGVAGGSVHRLDLAHVVPALGGEIDEERRVGAARARRDVGLGPGDQDGELGPARVGDEPLVAVDDPLVPVLLGPGLNEGRIGARHLGLGHGEAGHGGALAQAAQVVVLLRVGAPVQQRVHVALVGGHAVEDPWPEARLAGFGLHHGQLHVPEPHAAPLHRHVGQPQADALGLLAQLQDRDEVLVTSGDLALVVEPLDPRHHRVLDEGAHPGTDLLVLGGKGEVDGHVRLPGPQ